MAPNNTKTSRLARRRPQQSRSRALVDAVVEATFELLGQRGEAPTVRSIAERAGVGVGSIYEYFSSTEGVLEAVVDRFSVRNFEHFERRVRDSETSTTEALCLAILDETIKVYVRQPAITRSAVRVIFRYGGLAPITAKRDEITRRLAARIGRSFEHVSPAVVQSSVRGVADMTMGVLVSELYRETRDFQQRGLLVRMIRAELAHLGKLEAAARGQGSDPVEV